MGLLEIVVIIRTNTEVKHIVYVVYNMVYLKKFFHKGPNSDYHFIEKDLVEEFEEELSWLKENMKKHNFFSCNTKRN